MDWRLWKFLHYFHFDRVYWYVLENFSRPCVLCSTKCTTIYVSKTIVFVYVVKLLYSLPLYLSPCLCWQNKPVFMFVVVVCLSGDEQGAAVLSLSVSHYVSWQHKPVLNVCCYCLSGDEQRAAVLSLSLSYYVCWQYKPVLMFCCCCLSGDEQRAAVWSFPADSQHQKVWAPATLQRNAGT